MQIAQDSESKIPKQNLHLATSILQRHLRAITIATKLLTSLSRPNKHSMCLASQRITPSHTILVIPTQIQPRTPISRLAHTESLTTVWESRRRVERRASGAGTTKVVRRQRIACRHALWSTLTIRRTRIAFDIVSVIAVFDAGREDAVAADAVAVFIVELAYTLRV